MKVKTATLSHFKALDDEEGGEPEGTFEAVVSVFGNVDLAGDRVVHGAFAKSLETWKSSGDSIPVIWSHQWQNPDMHIGEVLEAEERDEGLWVKAQLDVADDPVAAKVWRLLSKRRVREFSFAYDVLDEKARKDANDLLELDVIEVGPTLKGMNPDTLLLEAKARREVRAGRARGAKGAVGTHETATSDAEWDGPANEGRLDNDAGEATFRKAFAWQDPDADADTKAAWKFIHHEVAEDGTVGAANLQACRTGIGVLNGGRSGTSIPEDDVQGVYDHLAAHIRDADEDPPSLGSDDDEEDDDEGSGSGSSSRGPGRKARVTLDGSVEQLQQHLSAAIGDWALAAFPRDLFIAGLEATWPAEGKAVVYVELFSEPWGGGTYHQASYETDDEGVISLSEPEPVELIGVVAPKSLPAEAKTKKEALMAHKAAAGTGGSPQSLLTTLAVAELDTA